MNLRTSTKTLCCDKFKRSRRTLIAIQHCIQLSWCRSFLQWINYLLIRNSSTPTQTELFLTYIAKYSALNLLLITAIAEKCIAYSSGELTGHYVDAKRARTNGERRRRYTFEVSSSRNWLRGKKLGLTHWSVVLIRCFTDFYCDLQTQKVVAWKRRCVSVYSTPSVDDELPNFARRTFAGEPISVFLQTSLTGCIYIKPVVVLI